MLNFVIYNKETYKNYNIPCLVFIAGYTATYEVWKSTVDIILQQHNYPVLLIDNLGAGKSPQPHGEYTTNMMANEVLKVFDSLNIDSFYLIGHSLGGAITQHITLLAPDKVKHLFLLSSFAKLDNICRLILENRYLLTKAQVDKRLIAMSAIPNIFANEFLLDKNNIELAINRMVSNPQTLDGMHGQLAACLSHDTSYEIKNINSPVTILTGDQDILVHPHHAHFLHDNIKHSTIHILANCGHMVQIERTKQIAELIMEHIII